MLRFAILAALASVGAAQQVVALGEDSKMRDELVYRVTWQTEYDSILTNPASKGTFTIQIKGATGETAAQTLVTHPGYSCGALSDAGCFPDISGAVLADSDASMDCNCDPQRDSYDEEAAKWNPKSRMSQSMNLKAEDVGEITEVVITGDNAASDSWTPAFIKIDTNTRTVDDTTGAQGGLGNGVYYIAGGQKINSEMSMEKKTEPGGDVTIKMEDVGTHSYGIVRCKAATCEEEMASKA